MMNIIMLVFFAMPANADDRAEMLNSDKGDKIKRLLAIDEKTRQKQAYYMPALKANQGNPLEDIRLYFSDSGVLQKSAYKRTTEKAREKTEERKYLADRRYIMVKPEE